MRRFTTPAVAIAAVVAVSFAYYYYINRQFAEDCGAHPPRELRAAPAAAGRANATQRCAHAANLVSSFGAMPDPETCRIGIWSGANILEHAESYWKNMLLPPLYKSDAKWMWLFTELYTDRAIHRGIARSSYYEPDQQKADLIYVPAYLGRLWEIKTHPSAHGILGAIEALKKSPQFLRHNGRNFVFSSGHVYGNGMAGLSKFSSIWIVTDPRNAPATDPFRYIGVPYSVFAPQSFVNGTLRRRRANATKKDYWVFFQGHWQSPANRVNERKKLHDAVLNMSSSGGNENYRILINDANVSDNPLAREENYFRSKYCLAILGHVASTLRATEVATGSCVPVLMSDAMVYPFEQYVGPYRDWAVFLPDTVSLDGVISALKSIDEATYRRKRERMLDIADYFTYKVEEVYAGDACAQRDMTTRTAVELVLRELCVRARILRALKAQDADAVALRAAAAAAVRAVAVNSSAL